MHTEHLLLPGTGANGKWDVAETLGQSGRSRMTPPSFGALVSLQHSEHSDPIWAQVPLGTIPHLYQIPFSPSSLPEPENQKHPENDFGLSVW